MRVFMDLFRSTTAVRGRDPPQNIPSRSNKTLESIACSRTCGVGVGTVGYPVIGLAGQSLPHCVTLRRCSPGLGAAELRQLQAGPPQTTAWLKEFRTGQVALNIFQDSVLRRFHPVRQKQAGLLAVC